MVTECRISNPFWRLLLILWLAAALALANVHLVSARQTIGPSQDAESQVAAGQDQVPVKILQLKIQVMPEFDDPRLLVIGQGRMEGSTGSSWELSFWIPEGSKVNLITSVSSAEEELDSQPYTLQSDPDRPGWALLSCEVFSPHFFYEYYYDGLNVQPDRLDRKSFDFTFSSPIPVESLVIELQQPWQANDFTSEPQAGSTRQDARYGLTYHLIKGGELGAGQAYTIQASYTKPDSSPSLVRQVSQASIGPAAGFPIAQTGLHELPDKGAYGPWICGGTLLLLGLASCAAAAILRRRSKAMMLAYINTRLEWMDDHCPRCGDAPRREALFCHCFGSRLDRSISAEA